MPTKKPRSSKLETANARRKLTLPKNKKPLYVKIAPNIALGYRRNKGPGTWSVRVTGPGIDWVKRIGLADDFEPADNRAVLSYWQAQDAAKKLARRQPGDDAADDSRPVTVGEALDRYEADLSARGGDVYNARRSRIHLPASILSKPIGLLRATELCKWRDGLIEKGLARDTVNRVRNCLRAALTLAAKRDRRIGNRHVWEDDLEALPNATKARNVVLADDVVTRLTTAAYARDRKLGLLCDVVSTTGARPSQAVRLLVGDLDLADRSTPQLLMPRSGKGHASKRATKMAERVRAQITPELAALLEREAKGRAGDAPLLTRSNGEPWGYRRSDQYRDEFTEVVEAAGLDPKTVTMYALRHSYISRALLRGISITLIADATDTSEKEIRRHYAKLISDHSTEIMRRALLQAEQPAANNIVALGGRRS
jgi:site-specific recombinase XerD